MAWLDNVYTFVSLIAALVTIGTPVAYLRNKASGKQLPSAEQHGGSAQRMSISLVEWMDFFKWGFVGAANSLSRSILRLIKRLEGGELNDRDREQFEGYVTISYGCGLLLLGFFLVIALTLVLFFHNGLTAVLAIMCMLLFVTVSFPYTYQVGKQIENRQHRDQSLLNQQEVTQ